MLIGRGIPLVVVLLVATVLTACATPAATMVPPRAAPTQGAFTGEMGAPAVQAPAATQAPAPTYASQASDAALQVAAYGPQMVIKNGDIRLLVANTDTALDGVTQIVSDVRGYLVSSRVWYQDYYGTNDK